MPPSTGSPASTARRSSVKTVLCFGDSLTWGYRPDGTGRHARQDRWPVAMGRVLGDGVEVIAEGLNGRTTAWDFLDGGPSERNGAKALPVALHSHAPLDVVVLMLGTNDVVNLRADAHRTGLGMARLAEIVLTHPYPAGTAPRLLLVAPPPLQPCPWVGPDQIRVSEELAATYRARADEFGVGFFDAGTVGRASDIDGVHLDADVSRRLGEAIADEVQRLLAERDMPR